MQQRTMNQVFGWACVLIGTLSWQAASAQILPPIDPPNLPVQTPLDVERTLNRALESTDPRRLRDLRGIRIRDLLRRNRRIMEADPRGAPVLRNEVVAVSPTQEALNKARAAGFDIARTRRLEDLDLTIIVLRAPEGVTTRRALRELREADPEGTYDFNHVYIEMGEVAPGPGDTGSSVSAPAASQAKVGMIDGGVDRSHVVFRGVTIHEHGCDKSVPSPHGTAVASLIAGHTDEFQGAAPGAQLYAADVYCGAPDGGAVDAIAGAFGWLAREKIPVINVSLVGPANTTLERVVRVMVARGHLIVAAVGNDGPSAKPLYPAAYEGVIAVTGVDARNRVLLEAGRGKHVDFAAPGTDIQAAASEEIYALVRGTSFAAPIVSGLLAMHLASPDRNAANAAIAKLIDAATDLGARGHDKIYGYGLVGAPLRARTPSVRAK